MFTGIIEGLGTIAAIQASGKGRRLTVTADFDLSQSRIGDSIAVNGACLTAVEIGSRRFVADVSPETLDRTTFGKAKIGERLNLERALRLSDRLDGHLVSGHIDGMGTIDQKKPAGNAVIVVIKVSESLSRYMIQKGSVAVDGISLTINQCSAGSFEVSIIPHTAGLTTIGFKAAGAAVNIETDMIGKYVERFLKPHHQPRTLETATGLDMQFLAKSGFL
ncbi:MAG: riboflavin synthase, partial [Desulfatirhabdiaceae bacterium]|nr:riboflavin synthase [Desulfatirhabdiaceae bacterium]